MKRLLSVVIISTTILLSFSSVNASAADYTVAPKDSLYQISQLFKTPIESIKSDNHLDGTTIYPGQVLSVPAQIYSVKSGDTMYLIAQRYGIPLSSLRKANNKWDNYITPGQQLILPSIKPASAGSGTVISYTKSEVDLLARLIQAEAGGESYKAMVAVGAVVVNRVQSVEWPSSINSVINQVIGEHYQFTPVKNGMIKNSPTDDSIRAAWAALYDSDPSNQAMFYFDDSSTNQWLRSKIRTARIDSMIFVK